MLVWLDRRRARREVLYISNTHRLSAWKFSKGEQSNLVTGKRTLLESEPPGFSSRAC